MNNKMKRWETYAGFVTKNKNFKIENKRIMNTIEEHKNEMRR